MYLKSIELAGFKSFAKRSELVFGSPIAAIVGPNGSGKSNVAEAFRFVLGEQSMKSMRSKRGEDLIWGGSPAMPRQGRASVKVVFDNEPDASGKRLLDVDFSEVVVERIVYRDGQNEYLLNGTQVRLKDVIRLLAGAQIGGSGYQIISQGEADRILQAAPKERREMVEDALGLKLYQHKKLESERKLEETAMNIEKTKSLRRELAPHIHFLKNQVEKIEKAKVMRDELAGKLAEYLARENAWIERERSRLLEDARSREREIKRLEELVQHARSTSEGSGTAGATELEIALREKERELNDVRRRGAELSLDLGRAEGALEANAVTVEQIVTAPHVRQFTHDIDQTLEEAARHDDLITVRGMIMHVRDRIKSFVDGLTEAAPMTNQEASDHVQELSANLEKNRAREESLAAELANLRAKIAEAREAGFAAQREVVELEGQLREARTRLVSVNDARSGVESLRQRFEEEVREGIVLLGAAIHEWTNRELSPEQLTEDRTEQEKRRREIERLKIKIEEAGIGGGDAVVKEFEQTKDRDEFLAKELIDLETSAASLKDIIAELERTIDVRFTEGLKHINVALKEFFSKLFNGGDAKLEIEEPKRKGSKARTEDDEEEEFEEEEDLYAGLSISVSLPRKKVAGLEVLSGGERALTSIALIFAMSQVNPPPFLILDETDAALDEANSRRYADMIRELGKKSQLIVITHNRATMAAAGELYGVTMGTDGVSKLLSVKLEEAERVAK